MFIESEFQSFIGRYWVWFAKWSLGKAGVEMLFFKKPSLSSLNLLQGRSSKESTLRRAQRRSFTPASFLEEDTVDFPDELDTSFFARVRHRFQIKDTASKLPYLENLA